MDEQRRHAMPDRGRAAVLEAATQSEVEDFASEEEVKAAYRFGR
jgi:hypothetical protein